MTFSLEHFHFEWRMPHSPSSSKDIMDMARFMLVKKNEEGSVRTIFRPVTFLVSFGHFGIVLVAVDVVLGTGMHQFLLPLNKTIVHNLH